VVQLKFIGFVICLEVAKMPEMKLHALSYVTRHGDKVISGLIWIVPEDEAEELVTELTARFGEPGSALVSPETARDWENAPGIVLDVDNL
jgi:hypothetical protein